MTLDDLVEGLEAGTRGALIRRKRRRSTWRAEAAFGTYFAKRGVGPDARDLVREARHARDLRDAGLPVVEVLAEGECDGAYWLVTAAAPGRPLDVRLPDAPPRARRWLLRHAARLVRALHAAGFRWPDMKCDHLFVSASPLAPLEAPRFAFIDVARAERPRGGVTAAHRARDLAALLFSLPYGCSSRLDRVRVVADACPDGSPLRGDVLRRVDAELRRLALRTRWRHAHAGAARDVVETLASLRGGGRGHGESLYAALLRADGMQVVRTLPDRENRRFGGFFMKVYPPVRRGFSPALRERCAIELFSRSGVPVCAEAAYGEDVEHGSFLVVRGCAGEPLDDLLRRGVTAAERKALARDLGRIFGRMRRAGLRHRDAYACHVFVARDPTRARGFELRLIDLTRGGRAPLPRERWFVKDVAQLLHGVRGSGAPVTAADMLRFLRAYFGIERLDARAKRFARRVTAKERRVAARQERKRGRA